MPGIEAIVWIDPPLVIERSLAGTTHEIVIAASNRRSSRSHSMGLKRSQDSPTRRYSRSPRSRRRISLSPS